MELVEKYLGRVTYLKRPLYFPPFLRILDGRGDLFVLIDDKRANYPVKPTLRVQILLTTIVFPDMVQSLLVKKIKVILIIRLLTITFITYQIMKIKL